MMKPVFDCQMCGQCCEGEGGIILSPKDLKRLYEGLNLEKQAFLDAYGVFRNGKWQVRTGEDGNCIFFRAGQGCSVHVIKPDVCRAWPFSAATWRMRKASTSPKASVPASGPTPRMRNSLRKAMPICRKTASSPPTLSMRAMRSCPSRKRIPLSDLRSSCRGSGPGRLRFRFRTS